MSDSIIQAWDLVIIPVLIGQYIGVIGLARTRRDRAWSSMAAGTVLQTIGLILTLVTLTWVKNNTGQWRPLDLVSFFTISRSCSLFGTLLFAIGFALMGWKAARRGDRITELELMNLAQATELERLRNR